METLALQSSVIYGPIASRRFGTSLGINILSQHEKTCNFSCTYCQYRDTPDKEGGFVAVETVRLEAGRAMARLNEAERRPDWLMICGNGEPTLHPEFEKIVSELVSIRNLFLPGTPIGILSNSSTCHLSSVRRGLMRLEGRFMKLDAGNVRSFVRVNRPAAPSLWADVVLGLSRLPDVVIQALFVAGEAGNTDEASIASWITAINYLKPKKVQIYTLDREPQLQKLLPASAATLNAIALRLRTHAGVPCHVYG